MKPKTTATENKPKSKDAAKPRGNAKPEDKAKAKGDAEGKGTAENNGQDGNVPGTIYDDVFRTIAQKMPEFMVALINAVYKADYGLDEARQLRNEFIEEGGKVITDSIFEIRNRIFHIECQSNPDSTMVIRMFEYDVSIAKEHAKREKGVYVIRFPQSFVLYLRHGKKKPGKSKAVIEFPDGKRVDYEFRNIYTDDYSMEKIFTEKLFALLPYYLMRHEDRFDEYEADEKARREFLQECAEIQRRMEECFIKDEDRSGTYQDLINLILKISNYLLAKHKKTKKGVNQVMGGRVLKLASEVSEERGKRIGVKQGVVIGDKQGEERTAEMFGWLASSGRYDDVQRASYDSEARAQFFKEYYASKPQVAQATVN